MTTNITEEEDLTTIKETTGRGQELRGGENEQRSTKILP
jgi:hypothetical protein